MTSRDDVFVTIGLMVEEPLLSDHDIILRLLSSGFDPLKAEVLCAFVPLGLARPVIRRISRIRLPKVAVITDQVNNREFKVRLDRVAEFREALQIGEETFETGILSSKELEAATKRSVELILLNKALNAGARIENGRMAPPYLLRLAEAPHFEEWYRQINARKKWF